MPNQTTESYYYGVPEDGGYTELYSEDGTIMRDTNPYELKRLWLKEAKVIATALNRKLFLIKETIEIMEVK